jgi:F-type H+-transporting ATPase subunit b
MIIDTFTVIAQIINFLILVLLLKKFLFNKIMGIIDEREEQIKEQIENTEKQQKDAEEEIKKQRKIREKMEENWDNDLAQMKKELQAKREKMMEESRQAVNEEEKDWKNSILKQRNAFLKELKELSCQQVCQISRKVLADLANEKLENQLIDSFLQQLEDTKDNNGQGFQLSDLDAKQVIEINTAFQLQKKEKEKITDRLKRFFQDEIDISFKESEDLICGIELRAKGKKISWSIESYLNSLEKNLQKLFEEVGNQQNIDNKEKDSTEVKEKEEE